jgi:plasmid stabilization system protein ParE
MSVEYSKRAFADLGQIAANYARSVNSAIAESIAERIQQVDDKISIPFSRKGRKTSSDAVSVTRSSLSFGKRIITLTDSGTIFVSIMVSILRRLQSGRRSST